MPKGPGTYGSKKGRPPEKDSGIPTYDAGGRTQSGDVSAYYTIGEKIQSGVDFLDYLGKKGKEKVIKTTSDIKEGAQQKVEDVKETIEGVKEDFSDFQDEKRGIKKEPKDYGKGVSEEKDYGEGVSEEVSKAEPKIEVKAEPKVEPKAEPKVEPKKEAKKEEPKTDPMKYAKRKKSPLLRPTTYKETGREKYAEGKKGSDQMTVDKLVEKRKTLTKGTTAYRENQNKINRLLGVDVKHSAVSDVKKKKSFSDKDMARVKSYMEKNWKMDDTINKAALAQYKKMNK